MSPEFKKVEGFGQGPFGIGPFGVPCLLIDLGAEIADPTKRYLVGHDVLGQIVSFLSDLVEELP